MDVSSVLAWKQKPGPISCLKCIRERWEGTGPTFPECASQHRPSAKLLGPKTAFSRLIHFNVARLRVAVLGDAAVGEGFDGPERGDRAEIDAADHGTGARKQIGQRIGCAAGSGFGADALEVEHGNYPADLPARVGTLPITASIPANLAV